MIRIKVKMIVSISSSTYLPHILRFILYYEYLNNIQNKAGKYFQFIKQNIYDNFIIYLELLKQI